MNNIINVFTGDVKTGTRTDILVSNAIASCIAVTAFEPKKKIGALAHVMLPGKSPDSVKQGKTKYAHDAIECLLNLLDDLEADLNILKICLIGGGNVLKKEDDIICKNNVKSVLNYLKKKQMKISAQALGGTQRRTVKFDIGNGKIYITEDGFKEILLWSFDEVKK